MYWRLALDGIVAALWVFPSMVAFLFAGMLACRLAEQTLWGYAGIVAVAWAGAEMTPVLRRQILEFWCRGEDGN